MQAPALPNDKILKNDLDQFKLELLQKINRRFLEESDKETSLKLKNEDSHMIKPEVYVDNISEDGLDENNKKDSMESLMAE